MVEYISSLIQLSFHPVVCIFYFPEVTPLMWKLTASSATLVFFTPQIQFSLKYINFVLFTFVLFLRFLLYCFNRRSHVIKCAANFPFSTLHMPAGRLRCESKSGSLKSHIFWTLNVVQDECSWCFVKDGYDVFFLFWTLIRMGMLGLISIKRTKKGVINEKFIIGESSAEKYCLMKSL